LGGKEAYSVAWPFSHPKGARKGYAFLDSPDPMTLLAIREQTMGGSVPMCLSVVALFGPLFAGFLQYLYEPKYELKTSRITTKNITGSSSPTAGKQSNILRCLPSIGKNSNRNTSSATMGRTILNGFMIVAVAALSALMYQYRDMTQKTARSVELLKEDFDHSETFSLDLFDKMPPVVQDYLTKALPELKKDPASVKRVKHLHMKQKGTFLMKDSWVPFTAVQDFSGALSNLGFVWDATVFLPELMPGFSTALGHFDLPVIVQDTYVRGKGLLAARLLGVLPVAHFEDNPEINAGELLRWLAESFLFPTVLIPTDKGVITWSPSVNDDPLKARLTVNDPHKNNKGTLTVQFNENGLPVSITGMRHKAKGNEFVIARWEGQMYDYKLVHGMMIPTRFDAGWWEGKKLELYFKGENIGFEYDFF
jgi:hypothetical protein